MKKTFITFVGAICTLAFLMPAAQATTQPAAAIFPDVPVGAEHYVAIRYLKERGILDGYEDGKFKPLNNINRAEALKIILSTPLSGAKKTAIVTETTTSEKPVITFSDVPEKAWFAPFVQEGVENKIINGYPDGKFQPEQSIKKVEALKMVVLQAKSQLPATPAAIAEPPYSDVPTDAWFAPYAQFSKDRGLILEDRQAGALNPDELLNRGQFAELIYHMLQSNNGYHFGRATYYADSLAGRGTSSGDPYKPGVFTTAHKTLPFGTRLLVTNLANGESIEVKVNDRGPYATGVELDLSKSAFAAIAAPSTGIIYTAYQIL